LADPKWGKLAGGNHLNWPKGLKHAENRDLWFRRFSEIEPGMEIKSLAKLWNCSHSSAWLWATLFRYPFPDLRGHSGRPRTKRWDHVDWKQTDIQLARAMGVTHQRVRQVRAARGFGPSAVRRPVPPNPPKGKIAAGNYVRWPAGFKHTAARDRWFTAFSWLEPGMELGEISKLWNCSYDAVRPWANVFQYPYERPRHPSKQSSQVWDKVDWTQRDSQLARAIGISRERVRQVRAARGIGPSDHQARLEQFERWVHANRKHLHGLRADEVIAKWGSPHSLSMARRLLKKAKVRPFSRGARWQEADWRLPNRDLARIWAVTPNCITDVRARLKMGPSQWRGKDRNLKANPAYQQAYAQELRRAGGGGKGPQASNSAKQRIGP